MTLRGQVELPEHLGSAMEVEADVDGDLDDPDTVEWRTRVDARGLDFEQWAALLPDSFVVPAAGHGSVIATVRGGGRSSRACGCGRISQELLTTGPNFARGR